jgi:hypothetical protein
MAIASDLTNLSPNKHKRLIRSTFSQGHLAQLYVIKRFAWPNDWPVHFVIGLTAGGWSEWFISRPLSLHRIGQFNRTESKQKIIIISQVSCYYQSFACLLLAGHQESVNNKTKLLGLFARRGRVYAATICRKGARSDTSVVVIYFVGQRDTDVVFSFPPCTYVWCTGNNQNCFFLLIMLSEKYSSA